MYKKGAIESATMLTMISIAVLLVYFAVGTAIMSLIIGAAISSGQLITGGVVGILAFIFGIMFLIGLLWIILGYLLVYEPLRHGRPEAAQTPALILGIVEIIFAGIIPGILLILAYSRIGSAIVYKEMEKRKGEI